MSPLVPPKNSSLSHDIVDAVHRVDVIYRQETRLLAEGVAGLKIASPVTLAAVALAAPRGPPEVINITKRVFVPSN